MNILGVHDGHNASIAFLQEGVIKYAVSEERITRVKNQGGMPVNSIKRLFDDLKISAKDIQYVALSGTTTPKKDWYERDLILSRYKKVAEHNFSFAKKIINKFNFYKYFQRKTNVDILSNKRISTLIGLGFKENQIHMVDHHTCHSYAAYFSRGQKESKTLILTNDGSGDGKCGTVNIAQGASVKTIGSVHKNDSYTALYARATFLMGMIPMEHEYKVMGMAPYGNPKRSKLITDKLLDLFIWSNNIPLQWKRKEGLHPTNTWFSILRDLFKYKRFDDISLAMQDFVEKMTLRWIKNCIRTTGIDDLVLSGGLFMNVKLSQKILELKEVKNLYVMPSCSDESNSFGAAYFCHVTKSKKPISPLTHLYLGPFFQNNIIKDSVNSYKYSNPVLIEKYDDVEEKISDLLFQGEIVARYSGREEFGARALGNRSILSDPSKLENIIKINKMIKNRDFWMPFAASFCESDIDSIILNQKNHFAPYMIITFNSSSIINNFRAATHPYDQTIRPQVVRKSWNEKYYELIKKFQKKKGCVSGILNTSFNLHGFPIVSTPEEAISVFEKSGLKYLSIGNFIIKKK